MADDFPAWVTNAAVVIPTGKNVPAKMTLFTLSACEKLRQHFNALGHWYRIKNDALQPGEADTLDADQQALLNAHAPYVGTGYSFGVGATAGARYNDFPTLAELRAWKLAWYDPRSDKWHGKRAAMRQAIENLDLTWIDLETLV